jgi:hypothetical protein
MLNRSNQYLQANKILIPRQFGFRKGNTIEKAICTVTIEKVICTVSENILTPLNHPGKIEGTFL